jgi:hypothetical protein
MVVISSGRQECGGIAELLRDLESQNAAIELQRSLQIGYLQVHMSDRHTRIDRIVPAIHTYS